MARLLKFACSENITLKPHEGYAEGEEKSTLRVAASGTLAERNEFV
jgi:hypothetical protein